MVHHILHRIHRELDLQNLLRDIQIHWPEELRTQVQGREIHSQVVARICLHCHRKTAAAGRTVPGVAATELTAEAAGCMRSAAVHNAPSPSMHKWRLREMLENWFRQWPLRRCTCKKKLHRGFLCDATAASERRLAICRDDLRRSIFK